MAQPTLTTSNPLRNTYDACWALLRSKVDFGLIFGDSNCYRQISVNSAAWWSSDDDVDHPSLGAHPRVRITVVKLDPNTERDSSGSQPVMTLEIQVWTGAQQQGLILDCTWTVFRAMLGWRQYARDTITWNGKPCVVDVDAKALEINKPELQSQGEGSDKRDSKGYNQWIGVWKCEILFTFRSLDLLNL